MLPQEKRATLLYHKAFVLKTQVLIRQNRVLCVWWFVPMRRCPVLVPYHIITPCDTRRSTSRCKRRIRSPYLLRSNTPLLRASTSHSPPSPVPARRQLSYVGDLLWLHHQQLSVYLLQGNSKHSCKKWHVAHQQRTTP